MDLHRQVVNTGLAFLQVQACRGLSDDRRRRDQDLVYSLRNSIQYRTDAVAWHASMLELLHRSAIRKLAASYPDQRAEYDIVFQVSNELHFVFDDLAFNAVALFDYVANFVGFALHGEHRRKAKWDRIQKYARDGVYEAKENASARVAGSRVGKQLLASHSALVDQLSEYRHRLIHQEALMGKAHSKAVFTPAGTSEYRVDFELLVTVPAEFTKRLPESGPTGRDARTSIVHAGRWLSECVEVQGRRLLRELERDLREEAGLDPDGDDTNIQIVM